MRESLSGAVAYARVIAKVYTESDTSRQAIVEKGCRRTEEKFMQAVLSVSANVDR